MAKNDRRLDRLEAQILPPSSQQMVKTYFVAGPKYCDGHAFLRTQGYDFSGHTSIVVNLVSANDPDRAPRDLTPEIRPENAVCARRGDV